MALTLIVEDGTGIEDANSYISLDFAEQYFAMQGSDLWEDNCDDQVLALIQASAFLDLRYSARFCGELVNADQGLLFPRMIANKNTGIPKQLKNAVASLAMQYMQNGNTLDLNGNQDMAVKSTSVSLGNGAIQETTSYYDNSDTKAQFSVFAITDAHLNQLMKSIGCESGAGGIMFIEAWRA